MIFKNCGGAIPEPGAFTAEDKAILSATDDLYRAARKEMNDQAVTKYLDAVWSVIAEVNRYFAAEEPWAKKKTDPARMATILYATAECVRQFAILAQPVMPESASKLLDLLAVPGDKRSFAHLGESGRLRAGTKIPEPQGVFPRYVEPE
jgi:methionyl-tRNA synthetase